jgi:two-component system, OmpR family, sensor histidine kinase BaeS
MARWGKQDWRERRDFRREFRARQHIRSPHSRSPHTHRSGGLRRRLTWMFVLLAFFAVVLTSLLTVTAAYRTLNRVAPELGLPTFGATGPPWEAADLTPEQQRWRVLGRAVGSELRRSAMTAGLISFAFAALLATLFTRQLTRPLRRLAEGARRLEAGERDLQLPVPPRQDELRDLTLAFNTLTTSLARQEAWRRSLMADIAHDLRTPLAVLRSEVEAMQDGVNPADEVGLGRVHGEVLVLARLVTDLRTLSLAESGAMDVHLLSLDAAELLRTLAASYLAPAQAANLRIRLSAPAPVMILADGQRLLQVLHNLLDNALRYAAPEAGQPSTLDLSASASGRYGLLVVRDHGPGFEPEALGRAFERFYRADVSRSRDPAGQRSSGLGLAIARALVQAQGGEIEARNHPDGGAEFTVKLLLDVGV